MKFEHIGIVGYGEVGRIFAAGLRPAVAFMRTWDAKFADTAANAAMLDHAGQAGVTACNSMQALCADSELVVSAVTAADTLVVAQEAARCIRAGTIFLDLNSASPGTKQAAARVIDAAGAHYIEAGVMASVPPHGIRVPMLLGGPHAVAVGAVLNALGMDARAVSDQVGIASAIKMCRSVMIKGLEALVIESYASARAYGVEDHVLSSLQETFPGIDWQQQGAYFFSRVVQHGQRRAGEMREAAHAVREAGFEPTMATAIADKQQWVADRARGGSFADIDKAATWQHYADRLLGMR